MVSNKTFCKVLSLAKELMSREQSCFQYSVFKHMYHVQSFKATVAREQTRLWVGGGGEDIQNYTCTVLNYWYQGCVGKYYYIFTISLQFTTYIFIQHL